MQLGRRDDSYGVVTTVNIALDVLPAAVVTVTACAPASALRLITSVAVMVVAFTMVNPVTVIPVGATVTIVPPETNPVPVIVIGTFAPARPLAGAMAETVGGNDSVTGIVPGTVSELHAWIARARIIITARLVPLLAFFGDLIRPE